MALLADLSRLRQSAPSRRLWAGSTLSLTGSALTRFAAVLQVYDVTRSTAAVGLIGLAVMVPLIDAADRRTLVLVTTTGNMAVAAAIAAQGYLHLSQVWPLYLLGCPRSPGTGSPPPRPVPGERPRR